MSLEFIRSLSSDFTTSNDINEDKIKVEINENSTITTEGTLVSIDRVGDSVKFTFDVTGSSSALESELNTVCADHDSAPLQIELDKIRFTKRAKVKDQIIAEMAAENMERVRTAVWTTADLISLTQDSELKDLLDDINSLSFEIAYSKIDALTNTLITTDIKDNWKLKLASHFYL